MCQRWVTGESELLHLPLHARSLRRRVFWWQLERPLLTIPWTPLAALPLDDLRALLWLVIRVDLGFVLDALAR